MMKYYKAAHAIEVGISIFLIVAIASAIVVFANPNKKISQERNDRRTDAVEKISNAISLYQSENGINSIKEIPIEDTCELYGSQICKTGSANCEGYVDLEVLTRNDKYLSTIPIDPSSRSQLGTGYSVVRNSTGVVTVCAPLAELKVDISLSK